MKRCPKCHGTGIGSYDPTEPHPAHRYGPCEHCAPPAPDRDRVTLRRALRCRVDAGETLEAIAEDLMLTRERVRQIVAGEA